MDNRSDFDKGFHEGMLSAYREVSSWSQSRLDMLDPGKNKKMRDDIETAHKVLQYRLRYYLPPEIYPEVWK